MRPFTLERPRDLSAALAYRAQAGRNDATAEYIGGGTDMVQLLQEDVRRPDRLVSLARLLDNRIEIDARGLRIGAGATMAEVAAHSEVMGQFPLINQALFNSASPQVRNQATIGGNLLQRTRCPYFRDIGYSACNKRHPGSGCAALEGENHWHAVLGTSESCIAVNPSDLAVALLALEAIVDVRRSSGQRSVLLAEFHKLPGTTPHIETVLEPGEVIASIRVPAQLAARRSHYLKVRDRASFEFAVVSAAVALDMEASAFGRRASPWVASERSRGESLRSRRPWRARASIGLSYEPRPRSPRKVRADTATTTSRSS